MTIDFRLVQIKYISKKDKEGINCFIDSAIKYNHGTELEEKQYIKKHNDYKILLSDFPNELHDKKIMYKINWT
jgi:hypothetical protein